MESSDRPDETGWIVAPFQGPLDVLFDRVITIEEGWEANGSMRPPVGEVHEDYLAALCKARSAMEAAMAATWSASTWAEYVREVSPDPDAPDLAERVAQAEFALVQTWNAQMIHAFGLGNPAAKFPAPSAFTTLVVPTPPAS